MCSSISRGVRFWLAESAGTPITLRSAMANRDVIIINNRIETVSQVYMDNSAILSTYVEGALILHNDIADAPYDGIDIGWGWGINDLGGNPVYRDARRGYYDHPHNLVYDTPTLHRERSSPTIVFTTSRSFFMTAGRSTTYPRAAIPSSRRTTFTISRSHRALFG